MPDSNDVYSAADDAGHRLLAHHSRYLFWLTMAVLTVAFAWLL